MASLGPNELNFDVDSLNNSHCMASDQSISCHTFSLDANKLIFCCFFMCIPEADEFILYFFDVYFQTEVNSLRGEVAQLKSLLMAHKDCPIFQQQRNTGQLNLEPGTDMFEICPAFA